MRCFASVEDHLVYMALLREVVPAAGCALHAYCLMPNHIHLLITPSAADSCAVLMRHVSFRYAQFFNRKHRRTGTLWEGRFRSCLVESREYVLSCHRYIETNPLRAELVRVAADYPWSSFPCNAGISKDPLITPHAEILAIGAAAYAALVEEALAPDALRAIRESTNGGYPLVSGAMKAILANVSDRALDPQAPGPKAKPERSGTVPDLFSGGGVS
jgi:putative transposase